MRFMLALAFLVILALAPPAAAAQRGGGGHGGFGIVSARGLHLQGRHARPFASGRFDRARGYGGGLGYGYWGGLGYGYWGDLGDFWDWGGMPATYDPAPAGRVGYPPPRLLASHDERDERASVETTPQGVTIIRGPGSHHIIER